MSVFNMLFSFFFLVVASVAVAENNNSFALNKPVDFIISYASVGGDCSHGDIGIDAAGAVMGCDGRWVKLVAQMDSGSLCGFRTDQHSSKEGGIGLKINQNCGGVNINSACPVGFTKQYWHEITQGGLKKFTGLPRVFYCVKD